MKNEENRECQNQGKAQLYKGVAYKSKYELCKAFNVDYNTFNSRKLLGWSNERAIDTPVKKKSRFIEIKNMTFKSAVEACEYFGKDYCTVRTRKYSKNCSWEYAMFNETSIVKREPKEINFRGSIYYSYRQVCLEYGLNQSLVYLNAQRKGITMEESLEWYVKKNKKEEGFNND